MGEAEIIRTNMWGGLLIVLEEEWGFSSDLCWVGGFPFGRPNSLPSPTPPPPGRLHPPHTFSCISSDIPYLLPNINAETQNRYSLLYPHTFLSGASLKTSGVLKLNLFERRKNEKTRVVFKLVGPARVCLHISVCFCTVCVFVQCVCVCTVCIARPWSDRASVPVSPALRSAAGVRPSLQCCRPLSASLPSPPPCSATTIVKKTTPAFKSHCDATHHISAQPFQNEGLLCSDVHSCFYSCEKKKKKKATCVL